MVGVKLKKKDDIVRKIVEIVNNPYTINDSLILIKKYTPKFFVGANKNLPMLMRKSHLYENIVTKKEAENIGLQVKRKHFHGLGLNTFLKVIKSLEHPQIVYRFTNKGKYKSNNYIALTNIKDKNDNPIIVPVQINQKGQYNNVEINCNRVKTVYGKENYNYFKKMVEAGYLFEIYNQKCCYSLSINLKIYNAYVANYDDIFDAKSNYDNAINVLLQDAQKYSVSY